MDLRRTRIDGMLLRRSVRQRAGKPRAASDEPPRRHDEWTALALTAPARACCRHAANEKGRERLMRLAAFSCYGLP
jgi:hypothetical protein